MATRRRRRVQRRYSFMSLAVDSHMTDFDLLPIFYAHPDVLTVYTITTHFCTNVGKKCDQEGMIA